MNSKEENPQDFCPNCVQEFGLTEICGMDPMYCYLLFGDVHYIFCIFRSPWPRKPSGGGENFFKKTSLTRFLGDLSLSASYLFRKKPVYTSHHMRSAVYDHRLRYLACECLKHLKRQIWHK